MLRMLKQILDHVDLLRKSFLMHNMINWSIFPFISLRERKREMRRIGRPPGSQTTMSCIGIA